MQLKKSPRDERYTETPAARYENDSFGVEPTDTRSDFQQDPSRQQRPTRNPGNGRMEGDDRAPGQTRSESVVDAHSSFDGRYETDHDLRIEGTMSGEVVCRGLLTIEQEASARARINSRDAHIRGRLEGDIVCSGKLLLASTAVVTGTLKAPILVVEEGASLSGSIDTTQKAGDIVSRGTPKASSSTAPAEDQVVTREREPRDAAQAAAAPAQRSQRREVPSFALVSSEAGTPAPAADRRS